MCSVAITLMFKNDLNLNSVQMHAARQPLRTLQSLHLKAFCHIYVKRLNGVSLKTPTKMLTTGADIHKGGLQELEFMQGKILKLILGTHTQLCT